MERDTKGGKVIVCGKRGDEGQLDVAEGRLDAVFCEESHLVSEDVAADASFAMDVAFGDVASGDIDACGAESGVGAGDFESGGITADLAELEESAPESISEPVSESIPAEKPLLPSRFDADSLSRMASRVSQVSAAMNASDIVRACKMADAAALAAMPHLAKGRAAGVAATKAAMAAPGFLAQAAAGGVRQVAAQRASKVVSAAVESLESALAEGEEDGASSRREPAQCGETEPVLSAVNGVSEQFDALETPAELETQEASEELDCRKTTGESIG